MRTGKSTVITTDSARLPAAGAASLTLAEVGSALEIPATSTVDAIFAPMKRNILENESKQFRKIQSAGRSKSLRPAFVAAGCQLKTAAMKRALR